MSARPLSIPERAARYLDTMAPAVSGQRGHDATFAAACVTANGFALPEDVCVGLLLAHYNPRCLPPWTEAELRHKVRDALASPSEKGRGYLLGKDDVPPAAAPAPADPCPKWPGRDPARIAAAVKAGPTARELSLQSPGPLDDEDRGRNCRPLVRALFADAEHPDPLLCVGKSNADFATWTLSEWCSRVRLVDYALIVPARMTARTGRTKEGKESAHALENTGPLLFVIAEFDAGTTDDHAALLWHLGQFAPLALVVHSGGKSLHGWFPVGDSPPDEVNKFMRYAATLGADPALFRNRSQFVRLPGGRRENGCRQSIFYWDPAALTAATINGEEAR